MIKNKKELTILGIETSCDDTACAVLKVKNGNFKVLSNVIASQIEVHKQYGGVYPFMAKREHQRNLLPTLETALKKAKIEKPDLISVTEGPGLEPCLWVGINFAKDLANKLNIPLIPVNHIESHILVNFLDNKKINFPAICLVVSGGHTQIILLEKPASVSLRKTSARQARFRSAPYGTSAWQVGKYKILGETRDDAAGECFDKCAKILGLPYPGGPAISAIAEKFQISNFKFQIKLPRPMANTKDYDFSFSGLKTAVLYDFKNRTKEVQKDSRYISEMCFQIQQAIIDVLLKKTIKSAKDYNAKSIILGGGVSANDELRKQFTENCKQKIKNCKVIFPEKNLSTDNAVMTAIAGYFHRNPSTRPAFSGNRSGQALEAKANLRIGE